MLKSARILSWLWPFLAVGFVASIVHLFTLRYQSGDVYPPYSSMRVDPLGAKAFYASLDRVRGLRVQRNLQPLDRLSDLGQVTLFNLGLNSRSLTQLDDETVKQWENLVLRGSRLVISFAPETSRPWRPPALERRNTVVPSRKGPLPPPKNKSAEPERRAEDPNPPGPGDQLPTLRPRRPPGQVPLTQFVSLKDSWGVGCNYEELPKNRRGEYEPVLARREEPSPLPGSFALHTALYFDQLSEPWQVLYTRAGHPVLIERQLGRGTIVLSADSYFLSNQAMRQDRYPDLLAWLVGPSKTVVFDETHLGVEEKPGLVALARKYRLHGLMLGVLLLAALFIWKSTYSLVPPSAVQAAHPSPDLVGGRDSATALVNLLRRSIPAPSLLFTCFEQWQAGHAHDRELWRRKIERMEAVLSEEQARPAAMRDPVQAYRKLSRIVVEKR